MAIPRTTLLSWAANPAALPEDAHAARRRKREEFARLADEASEWIITSLTQDDIDRASLRDKAVSYGVFRDKSLLDRGEPTQVIEHRRELFETLAERIYERALEAGHEMTLEAVKLKIVERIPAARAVLLPEKGRGEGASGVAPGPGIQTPSSTVPG